MYNGCKSKGSSYFTAPSLAVYDHKASLILGKTYDRIINPWQYHLNDEDQTHIKIDAGFLTDNASVPRLFWISVPPKGAYSQAAHGHDKLCEELKIYSQGKLKSISREEADDFLERMLFTLKVSNWDRKKIMFGVNLYRNTIGTSKPNPSKIKSKLELDYYTSDIARCIVSNIDTFKDELNRLNTTNKHI